MHTQHKVNYSPFIFGLMILMFAADGWHVHAQASQNEIVFSSNRDGNSEIYTMRSDGSNQTNITNTTGSETFPSWSPEGGRIVFVGAGGIWTMNADGTNQTQLTNVATDTRPAWSPDGRQIMFTRGAAATGINIFVMNADGGSPVQLTTAASGEQSAGSRWSPNGARIVFASIRSATGADNEIYVMNADGSAQTALTDNTAADALPDWSPDGSKIVFQSERDGAGNLEIYVMNANGSNPSRLTNSPTTDVSPGWSPDGTKVLFLTRRDGNLEIYVMNADGSSPIRLTSNPAEENSARWRPAPVLTLGLNRPTKIVTAGQSSLLVAEGGTMMPNSGRISLVNRTTGARRTLIDGLPSAVTLSSGSPIPAGPSGLKLDGQKLYLTIAAGNTSIPVMGVMGALTLNPDPSSPLFNSVLELTLPTDYETLASGFTLPFANQTTLNSNAPVTLNNAENKQLTIRLVVNLPDSVASPLPNVPANIRESNLYGVELSGDSLYVVDASFNLVYRVNTIAGTHSTFAAFAPKPNPTTMGPPMVEAVPDNVRLAGDQLLVPYLTGFPFVPDLAEIRGVSLQGGTQSTFIPSLTSAIDVLPLNGTGGNDSFLVLEFSANQLGQLSGRLQLFTSRNEAPRVLSTSLISPTSLARDAASGSIFIVENTPGRIVRVAAPHTAPLDYFGTGRSDYAVLAYSENPNFIRWTFLRNPVTQPAQIRQVAWGFVNDEPVSGDYDGDLRMDVGVWRPGTVADPQSSFFVQHSGNTDPRAIHGRQWGLASDEPIVGDFDGDRKDDFTVVRREGANLSWYSLASGGAGVRRTVFGLGTDSPAFAGEDFNYDGREDLIVIRRDEATLTLTTYVGDALTGNLILAQPWGNANGALGGAVFVLYGNYLGDSRADIMVYHGACPSNPTCEIAGTWWVKETGSSNFTVTKFGIPFNNQTMTGDLPVQGDFDGDGKLDISVFRRTSNTFYSLLSSNGQTKAQYFDGDSAAPSTNGNSPEPPAKLIPAGIQNTVILTKNPDGSFRTERASESCFEP